ncbi:MAG: ABC transporter ATP-binding protein [Candidatus Adiutrix sp.]|jgi:ABC-type multidrug transport system ATPase subunit|nr:ABC transporter ATP-binding protein [Candidatus Adiutrix sp.]
MSELYALTGLRRVFAGREVLAIPALTIEAGLIYGLLGPNGAGKTTLMKLLAFLETPDEGQIVFRGRRVTPQNMAGFRSQVVWSPQSPVMFTGTLRDNVEYPLKLKKVANPERRRRALELLDLVGLAALAEAPARRLSGGEAQRGSLARALAAGAEVLLLDEPTANVDAQARRGLVNLVASLGRDLHLSIIITTHDTGLDAELCRKKIELRHGHLVAVEESLTRLGRLRVEGGRYTLAFQECESYGSLSVTALANHQDGVRLKLTTTDRRALEVRLEDPASLEAAGRLTLSDTLFPRSADDAVGG